MSGVTPALRILVLGGVANLSLSFLLGFVLSAKRMKEGMERHHWLLVAHEVSLQEGLLLLGVAYASTFAALSEGWMLAGAWLMVVASAFQDFSGVVNWLRGTKDQFAERSGGWMLASINAVLNAAGLAILTTGVVRGLW